MAEKIKKCNKKFTKLRRPYKAYNLANWTWKDVFEDIENTKLSDKKFLKTISAKYGIIHKTLKNKYSKYKNNPDNFNLHDVRGMCNLLLNAQQEQELYDHLNENFITKNKPLNNNMIIKIAKDKFESLIKNKNNGANLFSNFWCSSFKKRNNLSTRRVKASKIATTIITAEKLNKFINDCKRLIKFVGKKNFFNYDESSEKIANPPKTAIRLKNSQNIKILSHNNLKENVTVGITECMEGYFLKSIVVIKGKTKVSFKKYGNVPDNLCLSPTKSGWVSDNVMEIVLNQIFEVTNGNKCVLLLDRYPVHTNECFKKKAKKYNIILIYVPEGLTYKYQPLDVTINSIIKVKLEKKYTDFIINNDDHKYTLNKFLLDL